MGIGDAAMRVCVMARTSRRLPLVVRPSVASMGVESGVEGQTDRHNVWPWTCLGALSAHWREGKKRGRAVSKNKRARGRERLGAATAGPLVRAGCMIAPDTDTGLPELSMCCRCCQVLLGASDSAADSTHVVVCLRTTGFLISSSGNVLVPLFFFFSLCQR
jgi:hypothetical protein